MTTLIIYSNNSISTVIIVASHPLNLTRLESLTAPQNFVAQDVFLFI